jgi:ferric-dicitrate binding protein FerR (iron transport regulator)
MTPFSHEQYAAFTETDFIQDPFFQEWVLAPDTAKHAFWEAFLTRFPQQRETVERAQAWLQGLQFAEEVPDEAHVRQRFAEHLAQAQSGRPAPVVGLSYTVRRALKVAAFVGGLVLAASVVFQMYNRQRQTAITTQFGELKEVRLPDSTTIILAAHSKLTYKSSWRKSAPREIWLDGEAFFSVRHLNRNVQNIRPHERFIVHGKDVTVEVLGTEFDMRQRRGKTEVVLQQGSIRLRFNDSAYAPLLLAPGDLVAYDGVLKKLERSTTVPQNYTAWKEKTLLLTNPTVEEILNYLEDNFGKELVLNDTVLLQKRIEGPILLNNLNDALFVLSTVLNTDIERHDSLIRLKPRPRS